MNQSLVFLIFIVCLFQFSTSFNVNLYKKVVKKMSKDLFFQKDFIDNVLNILEHESHYYDWTPFGKNYTFDCDFSQRYPPATSVHRLRPSDIRVVAAMGDSLTAGLGSIAKNVDGLTIEYRGRSWSIGGDLDLNQLITLPNILKKFNSKLTGFSTGSNVVFTENQNAGLNMAISGKEANNIPSQVDRLIRKMKTLRNIDFNRDWKLITLFIGGNDLCRSCFSPDKFSPESYINDIKIGLDMLYRFVPKAFVNFVSVLNVSLVNELNNGMTCSVLHRLECNCGAFPVGNQTEELKSYIDQYHNFTEALVNSGRYDRRDDFAIVVQPFFIDFRVPTLENGSPDYSYLAPDCFHFSTKGHGMLYI
jgi:phospholipase B1